MTQKTAITVRVSAELLKVIDAKAGKEFCSRGEAASMLLASSDGGAVEPSRMATMKEREQELKLNSLEREAARQAKMLLLVEEAVKVVETYFGEMKTEGHTMMQDIARDFDLNAAELERRFDLAMAAPFEVTAAPFQRAADDFAEKGPTLT